MKVNLIRVINESVSSGSDFASKVRAELSRGIQDSSVVSTITDWAVHWNSAGHLNGIKIRDYIEGRGNSGMVEFDAIGLEVMEQNGHEDTRVRALHDLSDRLDKPGQFAHYYEVGADSPRSSYDAYSSELSYIGVAYGFTPRPELGGKSARGNHSSRDVEDNMELFTQYMLIDESYHHIDEDSYGLDVWATHPSDTGDFANDLINGTGKVRVNGSERFITNVDLFDEIVKGNIKNVDDYIHHRSDLVRRAVARVGHGLDKLINDEDSWVRAEVAEQGYGLDKLINDEHWRVRKAVARKGYGLDKLVNDKYWMVRKEVAEQGYGLDKLVNDKYWMVRKEVAEQGYGLDKLINDPDKYVRRVVAEQGYGLDKLINDPDKYVRIAVAEQGYGLDKLINDSNEWVREVALDKLSRKEK